MPGSIPYLLLLLIALPTLAFSQTQEVTGLSFDSVVLLGRSSLQVRQGLETKLLFRGDENQQQDLPFFVNDETLVLGRQESSAAYQFKLTVRELSRLAVKGPGIVFVRPLEVESFQASLDGSGQLKLFSLIAQDDISLRLHGTGDIQVASLVCDDLEMVLSGPGNMHLGRLAVKEIDIALKGSGAITAQHEGTVEQVEIDIVGAGRVSLEPVVGRIVEVSIMGAGKAFVSAVEELEVNIIGSAQVHYKGQPDIDESVIGSGRVHHER